MKLLLAAAGLVCGINAGLAQESIVIEQCVEVEGTPVCDVQTTRPPKPPEPLVDPSAGAGARLPITYEIADLGGTPRYVATNGSGTACTEASPCASIKDAQNAAVDGDPIIVRGGTYRNHGNTWNGSWDYETFITKHGIQVLAAPGETVIFDGTSNLIHSFWTIDGSYKWATYTPRPCGNGFGITFCTESSNDNVNGTDSVYPYNVGKYIDQVWVDGHRLQEVANKADLDDTRFWIDRINQRVYLTRATRDAARSEVAVCDRGDFITVHGHDVTLAGFRVQRYCNSQARAALLDVAPTADRFLMHDVILDNAIIALFLQGTSTDALQDASIEHVTVTNMNWMGINLMYNTRVTFDGVKITGMDKWNEFASSPGSGAIKTSRVSHSTVKNSYFANNSSQGVWYDQSNFDAEVFNNRFEGTGVPGERSMFFYEISDELDFYNNVIIAPVGTAIKIAGSSNVRILNNTVVGGKDTLGIYADNRSMLDCAKKGTVAGSGAACSGYSSDRWAATWKAVPAEMDWLTRVSVVQGNILAYPVATGLCGGLTVTCIVRINGPTDLKLENILPNGVVFDCNVYATSSGDLVRHNHPTSSTSWVGYTDLPAFTSAMAQASPWPSEQRIEAHGLAGVEYVNPDGTPTALLGSLHAASPCGFPADAVMNATIPAGTKHYGVTYR